MLYWYLLSVEYCSKSVHSLFTVHALGLRRRISSKYSSNHPLQGQDALALPSSSCAMVASRPSMERRFSRGSVSTIIEATFSICKCSSWCIL